MEACSRHSIEREPNPARVLVACTGSAQQVLARVFAGWAEWTPVYTLEAALQGLEAHPDLIVCTLRFDDSRMLELAAEVAHRGDVPWVCCRVGEGELPEPSVAAAMIAAENLGAIACVDLPRLARECGMDEAIARFRAEVLSAFA